MVSAEVFTPLTLRFVNSQTWQGPCGVVSTSSEFT